MMKKFIFLSFVTLFIGACSSNSDEVCKSECMLKSLSNSTCKGITYAVNSTTDNVEKVPATFSIILDGVAKCNFANVIYACDFGKINVNFKMDGNDIVIEEFPESNMADCQCQADVSFEITNLLEGTYNLVIYHYPKSSTNQPRLNKQITLKKGVEVVLPY